MCDVSRERLMLYFDGELDQQELGTMAEHVATCPHCQKEMKSFQSLDRMMHQVQETEALSRDEDQAYYSCVCRKMAQGNSWNAIYGIALFVVAVGSLTLFTLPRTAVYQSLGIMALGLGAGIVWLGQYCRCRS